MLKFNVMVSERYKAYNNFDPENKADFFEQHSASLIYNINHPLTIDEQSDHIPLRKYRDQILFGLENYQIVILVGEAGSNISNKISQYLYQFGWNIKGMIGLTEPCKHSVISHAERVATEMGEVLGYTVGVASNFYKKMSDETEIKLMTEEILLNEILNDPLLTQFSVLIINDADERNKMTDTLLGLLKKILKKRLTLRIIICSSSPSDGEFFKNFFGMNAQVSKMSSSIILSAHRRSHTVNLFYKKVSCSNYVLAVVDTVWKIHNNEPPGSILAFLAGKNEVIKAYNLLKEYTIYNDCSDIRLIPMLGPYRNREQLKIFLRSPKGVRNVVIYSNISEASIYIPNIVYVVDCGFQLLRCYNSVSFCDDLVIIPVTKKSAEKRTVCAGLERPGKVYRLYSEHNFELLRDQTPPEMRRIDLCSTLLHLKVLGVTNILRFDFPTSPPAKHILIAVDILFALGAIDVKGKLQKPVGYFLADMPFGPMLGKMLYMSGIIGCSEEVITIIAMLQAQPIFKNPTSKVDVIKTRIAKRYFEVAEGDLVTLLNIYTAFVDCDRKKEFSRQYNLIYRNLIRAHEIRDQLVVSVTKKYGIPLGSCKGNVDLLGKCITAGFFPNAAYLHHSGNYKAIRGNTELFVHPLSALRTLRKPHFVIYYETVETSKLYMKDLTPIKENWLTEFASHYYQKKIFDGIFEKL